MDFDGTLSWLSWVCATFLFSYGFFQRTSTSAYYSDLETEFGLDGAGVGSLSSMYFYIYGIVQIPYGILMDKYGPLPVTCSSAFFTFIGALCFSLSPSLFVAYIGRGLVGGAVGVGWIAIIKVIQDDDYFLGKKQVLTGLSLSMGMLGGSLGQGPLAAFCKSSGWRFAMSVTSLIPLFVTNFSTSGVMLTNALLVFVLNVRYSVNDFIIYIEDNTIKIQSCRLRTQDPNHQYHRISYITVCSRNSR